MSVDKKIACAFTTPFNEPFSTHLWLNYYSTYLGADNVFVVMTNPSESVYQKLRDDHPTVTFIARPQSTVFPMFTVELEDWRREIVKQYQAHLLEKYQIVIFTDPDEYLVPHDGNLADFCRQFAASHLVHARATGYNVVQQIDVEPDINRTPGVDVLTNRSTMYRGASYDKTLITKKPLMYSAGFHSFYEHGTRMNWEPYRAIDLCHCPCVDLPAWIEQCGKRYTNLNRDNIKRAFNTQNMSWLTNNPDTEQQLPQQLPIPNHWRGKILY